MPEPISVIMIDPDAPSRQALKVMFKKAPWIAVVAEAADLTRGYQVVQELQPTLVLLDLFPPAEQALKLVEKITQSAPQTTTWVTCTQNAPELIVKAMRAGAREFLAKPLKKDELVNAMNSLVRRQNQRRAEAGAGGKILATFSAKGGVGTTTIATNLAVNLAAQKNKSVVLVDLNLQLGNAALFFDIRSEYSIVDLANHLKTLEPGLVKSVLPKHASGAWLLSHPSRVEEAESLTSAHLEKILALLRSLFDVVIIDTSHTLDDLTLQVLDAADAILTVCTVDFPTIYNTRRCLNIFERIGYGPNKVLLLMNRYSANSSLGFEELIKSINYPVFWKIPNQDDEILAHSINQGIPICTLAPKSKLGRNLDQLATQLNGGAAAGLDGIEKSANGRLMKKLFSR